MNTKLLINKLAKKGGFKTPYNEDFNSWDGRFRRYIVGSKHKGGWVTGHGDNIVDFSEFPVLSHFMSCYGMHPSIFKIDLFCNYEVFMNRIHSINKSFYLDTLNIHNRERDIHNAIIYRKFICLGDKARNCFYYITIDGESENKYISITVLFNPKEDSVIFFDKIKTEVFYDLPEVKKNIANYLHIMVATSSGYKLEAIKVKCPEIDFDLNYNSDFKPIHDVILERLSEDKSKGLVLLHGKAGTGKTNYIRYLINHLKKKVIYIPPNMSNSIADPNLIKFFIEHSNSVLVIEDAENVLMKRNSNSSQAISNILNLTDGLLSDCTNIQVIATFNTDVLNIDEALLRKGRLICKYEFGELEPEITEKLANKIGSDIRGKKVLAEIYNSKDESFTNKKEKIGFNK